MLFPLRRCAAFLTSHVTPWPLHHHSSLSLYTNPRPQAYFNTATVLHSFPPCDDNRVGERREKNFISSLHMGYWLFSPTLSKNSLSYMAFKKRAVTAVVWRACLMRGWTVTPWPLQRGWQLIILSSWQVERRKKQHIERESIQTFRVALACGLFVTVFVCMYVYLYVYTSFGRLSNALLLV